MLILNTLALSPLHGVGIARRIEQVTHGTFVVKAGSLFPALHRMEEAGWIHAEWITKDTGRRARIYELTATGKKQLAAEESRWQSVTSAVNRVLRTV
jgi:PadR family transcriptional regulator PadR